MTFSATDLANDLKNKAATVPDFTKKVAIVYSIDDLFDHMKTARPGVGVLYEGARSVGQHNERAGVSGEAVFSLIMLCETSVMSNLVDTKTKAHQLLDALRYAIQGTRSPAMAPWKWVLEAPAAQKHASTIWLQRWTTPVQSTPAPDARQR